MRLHIGDAMPGKRRDALQRADLVGDHALDLGGAVAQDDATAETREIVEAGMRAERDALLLRQAAVRNMMCGSPA